MVRKARGALLQPDDGISNSIDFPACLAMIYVRIGMLQKSELIVTVRILM